ncbi:MAG: hypothetical protein ACKVJG_04720 [Candidatus Latescibacterota bacterium]|jgi:anti-sigma factor RsiW|tara:strand:+ start:70 stop:480 length:411 start_codon:yes stop_codon:yes gene_type:complete
MNSDYREMMLRALEDDLNATEQSAFAAALTQDSSLRAEWQELQQLQGRLAASRAHSFKPFFAARVTQRIHTRQNDSLTEGLLWIFKPLVSAVAVVALFIALSNWNERASIDEEASVLEAVFAVEPVSLDAAYAMEQ